jgi:hypothetical protein
MAAEVLEPIPNRAAAETVNAALPEAAVPALAEFRSYLGVTRQIQAADRLVQGQGRLVRVVCRLVQELEPLAPTE